MPFAPWVLRQKGDVDAPVAREVAEGEGPAGLGAVLDVEGLRAGEPGLSVPVGDDDLGRLAEVDDVHVAVCVHVRDVE